MFQFGSGSIFVSPANVPGVSAVNPTPVQIGTLQDSSLDISQTVKELYGRNSFPDSTQVAEGKITGKIKAGRISTKIWLDSMFGANATSTIGGNTLALDEVGTIPGATTYTVSVANAAHFVDDLGVRFYNSGAPLEKVSASPTTGQYAVNVATGVYTFASADANAMVYISYTWSTSSATTAVAKKVLVKNMPMGAKPRVKLYLYNTNDSGQQMGITLFSAIIVKLSLPMKNQDFVIPESEFSASADASGNVMEWDVAE